MAGNAYLFSADEAQLAYLCRELEVSSLSINTVAPEQLCKYH